MTRSRKAVLAETTAFMRTLTLWLGVFLFVHVIGKNDSPRNSLRLMWTILYFISLIALAWHLAFARSKWMVHLWEWLYHDAPPSVERLWRGTLRSLDRLIRPYCLAVAVCAASIMLLVLDDWFPSLRRLEGVASPAMKLAMFSLLLLPFAGSYLIAEFWQRLRLLRDETGMTTWYRPRRLQSLLTDKTDRAEREPPVVVTGPQQFRIGGTDWHWHDLKANAIVFGQSGSGKTVCVLNSILDAVLSCGQQSELPPGALILDPKGDYRDKIEVLCRRLGREDDLLTLCPARPESSIHWNPFDSDDDSLELASRFAATLETLGMKSEDTSFWIDSARKFIRNAISLLRLTSDQPPSFTEVYELATSFDAIADRVELLHDSSREATLCMTYFENEWANYADEMRSSIQAHICNMIEPFLIEPYDSIFSGYSTVRIADALREGRIIYVDMPVADREAMSRTVGTLIKQEYFREVLKQLNKPRPTLFLCDEFQSFFTIGQGRGDADFFERSRQSNHVNIVATQNLPALLKTVPKKEPVLNLIGNCAVKVFLRNTEVETNEFAAKLFGQRLVAMDTSAAGQGKMGIGRVSLGAGMSAGTQSTYDYIIRPERFTELAIPSLSEGTDYCESIIHMASRAEHTAAQRRFRWKANPLTDHACDTPPFDFVRQHRQEPSPCGSSGI